MIESRSKRASLSTIIALILEIVTIISGLIIPRLILSYFGSEVNGLVSSITQFLGYVSLLQLGVGGVIRAALYKPLADKDTYYISKVMKASNLFFGKIAIISIFYIIALSLIYPIISNNSFDYFFSLLLVVILGLDTIAQYAWGFPNRQLLYSDQRSYLYDITRIISISLNVIITVALIRMGCQIHLVKLGSAIVFILQPFLLNMYVVKKYKLIKDVEPDDSAVKQRWAGVGYSLADFVHRKTDIFVLTLLSTLKEVSVYSIYGIVVNGVNSVITMATGTFQAVLGDMIAKKEESLLKTSLAMYEFIVHTISAIVFSTTACLIVPFVTIYTTGVDDANYSRPLFALIIVIAEMLYCLRQPYQSVVVAAGHFKQTEKGAIIEASMNLFLSVLLVKHFGIVGVAIGTLIAMVYRTVDLIFYLKYNLVHIKINKIIKRYICTTLQFSITFVIFIYLDIEIITIIDWTISALTVFLGASILSIGSNIVLFHDDFVEVKKRLTVIFKIK